METCRVESEKDTTVAKHWKRYLRRLETRKAKQGLESSDMEGVTRVAFSKENLMEALVNFIAVDDQVCIQSHDESLLTLATQAIRLVEVPEFRQLILLLNHTLSDKDIPHRTKVHLEVAKSWSIRFARLKQELAVRFSPPFIT